MENPRVGSTQAVAHGGALAGEDGGQPRTGDGDGEVLVFKLGRGGAPRHHADVGKPKAALYWTEARRRGGATVDRDGRRWRPWRRRSGGWRTKPRPPGNSGCRGGAMYAKNWPQLHCGPRSTWWSSPPELGRNVAAVMILGAGREVERWTRHGTG
uniref:Uncharacterized protein n=1 Tax=Arundo donax TaxID=35708 RepID=A0A0A9GWS4_ARUDO